ncbi:Cell wall / vacuolar inhibitor of fructosidase 2 [Linum perenne]
MDNNSTTCSIFLLLLLLTHAPPTGADKILIQKTCKSTKYYDLCISSLSSNSTSSTADLKGLALIMIGIGMANATATSSYLSSATSDNNNGADLKRAVLKECADKYMYAGDALQYSVEDLGMEDYDYASIHVTAAADYPSACHNAFRRNSGRVVYPPELARREDGLKRICDVVLGMINLLIGN